MINFIVSFDDLDPVLGKYFHKSHLDFYEFISEHPVLLNEYKEIPTSKTYRHYIDKTTRQYNSKSFVYIIYSHGNANEFRCAGMPYICSSNANNFINSFVYSTACLTGKKLAHDLINNGCKTFVGYKEVSYAFLGKYRDISINCDNYALKMFLLMDVSIEEAVNSMKKYITQQIDKLDKNYENPLYTARLAANREALICIGNTLLKKEDIFI